MGVVDVLYLKIIVIVFRVYREIFFEELDVWRNILFRIFLVWDGMVKWGNIFNLSFFKYRGLFFL